MAKSKNQDSDSLLSEKVVDINSYRSLQQTKENPRFALVTDDASLVETLRSEIKNEADMDHFDSPFSFEKGLKETRFDVILLDERTLGKEALPLCEKLKRQEEDQTPSVIVISKSRDKKLVRKGYEMGCDEWITRLDDLPHLAKLMLYHSNH